MKRNRLLALLADTRGASAVEFALVAGPFLLILVGSVEFGRYVWTRQAIQDTAIAGARCVGVLQRPCEQDGVFNPTKARNFVIATAPIRIRTPLNSTRPPTTEMARVTLFITLRTVSSISRRSITDTFGNFTTRSCVSRARCAGSSRLARTGAIYQCGALSNVPAPNTNIDATNAAMTTSADKGAIRDVTQIEHGRK